MSKPKSERLAIVRKLAHDKEQKAAQQLVDLRAIIERETRQLEQLQDYHADYRSRIDVQKKTRIVDVITFREFSQRLAVAVDQQLKKVELYKSKLEMASKKWVVLREKRRSIEDIISQNRDQEQGDRDRLEQKSLDEMATRASATLVQGTRF